MDQQAREEVLRALREADEERERARIIDELGGKYAKVKVTLDIVWFGAFQVEIDCSELVAAEDFKELAAKVNHAAFRGLGELVRSNYEEMHRHTDGGDEDIETEV